MAYYLKKTKRNNSIYLQIYESFYNPDKGATSSRCVRSLGNINKIIDSGIADPVAYYSAVVEDMNADYISPKKQNDLKEISDVSPLKHIGYFPLKNVMTSLDVEKHINNLASTRRFDFDVFKLLSSLVYARVINPCSKHRTFHDVLPNLYENINVSYSQIRDLCEYLGFEMDRIIEIFTHAVVDHYGLDSSRVFFDCTNFFFEIDREDDFKRKGPCKENRPLPIVGMGLLLDANCIPIGMTMYPGNQSEKPELRKVVQKIKDQNNITGKTIRVADKGLNCAENIYNASKSGDGYLFSKSVRAASEVEKAWIFNENDNWKEVTDEKGNLLYKYHCCTETFEYAFTNPDGSKHPFKKREKRMVTYNPKLAKKQTMEINKLVEKAKAGAYAKAKKSALGEAAKYVDFITEKVDENGEIKKEKMAVSVNQKKIDADLQACGYNMLVTSELNMDCNTIYSTYHQLWRIEESFKVMKSDLDARPVFLQKEDSIKGHFVICYLAILLLRLLQIHVLKDEFGSGKILEFIRNFNILEAGKDQYTNIMTRSEFNQYIKDQWNFPVTNYYLNKRQIKRMLTHEILTPK